MHFYCVFCVFSCYSRLVSLQLTIHQYSWNLLVITPTTTVDVHSSYLYAGVEGIYFALKDHQQRAHSAGRQLHVVKGALDIINCRWKRGVDVVEDTRHDDECRFVASCEPDQAPFQGSSAVKKPSLSARIEARRMLSPASCCVSMS